MRKYVALILAALLSVSAPLILTACNDEGAPTVFTETPKESGSVSEMESYELSEGYALYTRGPVSFAYPAEWFVAKGGGTHMLSPEELTENGTPSSYITVTYSVNTVEKEDITTEWYLDRLESKLEAAGASVSGFTVTQKTNEAGVFVAVAEYRLTVEGSSADQTQYVVKGRGNTYYFITFTLEEEYSEILTTVFESLRVKQGY